MSVSGNVLGNVGALGAGNVKTLLSMGLCSPPPLPRFIATLSCLLFASTHTSLRDGDVNDVLTLSIARVGSGMVGHTSRYSASGKG